MTVWSFGILIIAVVIMGSITIGLGDSRRKGWWNKNDDRHGDRGLGNARLRGQGNDDDGDDDDGGGDDDRRQDRGPSLLLCPCSQGCCDDQWYQYKDACYFPVHTIENWERAKQNCEHFNAHLASVHSEDEDSFIFHLMRKKEGYWLGAEKIDDRATRWKWIDNSPWDYSDKMIDHNNPFHVLAVDKMHNEAKTYWRIVPKDSKCNYVCKYLLD
ncbi:C-type lectin domain family 4 member D isoform X1 [Anolis carolinensis]|uniref:C-type lectin domain family 4 member D isoform X1 n=1 Tax=Anolis carolinensis TaxID=28377 RepID=UPI0002C89915|nr:PREDICTED: C-type lectin domain family 4 member D [Anolis carolinensis]|eukprot:XP_008122284.1 PREDICTED: C-type lectin domain family 4 member D [Anolis carolinensis]